MAGEEVWGCWQTEQQWQRKMKENFRGDEKPYCVCGFILWSAVLAARLCLTHEGSTRFPCQQSKQLAWCPPKPSTLLLSSHFSQSMGHRWGETPRKKGGRRRCQTAVCRELTQQRPVDWMMALNGSTFTHTPVHTFALRSPSASRLSHFQAWTHTPLAPPTFMPRWGGQMKSGGN